MYIKTHQLSRSGYPLISIVVVSSLFLFSQFMVSHISVPIFYPSHILNEIIAFIEQYFLIFILETYCDSFLLLLKNKAYIMVIEFPLFPLIIIIFYTFFQPLKIADIFFTLQMIWHTPTLILILPFIPHRYWVSTVAGRWA